MTADEHGTETGTPIPTGRDVRLSSTVPLVAGLLCSQVALLLAFANGYVGPVAFAGLHLSTCTATAAVGFLRLRSASNEAALAFQIAAWTALGGAFGSAVAAALPVPWNPGAEKTGSKPTAAPPNLTRLELLHGALLDRRLRIAGAHATRPLLDVIIDGGQLEKFDALSLIAKNYEPALAPALRRALEDRDGSVRVLAATVIAQMNNANTRRIGTLQAAAVADPDNGTLWLDLGQAHLDYAESGLLDASRTEAEAARAAEHLARAIAIAPDSQKAAARLDVARGLATPPRRRATVVMELNRMPDGNMVPTDAV